MTLDVRKQHINPIEAARRTGCRNQLLNAIWNRREITRPYPHCLMDNLLEAQDLAAFTAIDLPLIEMGGVSGERALHNQGRQFFGPTERAQYPVYDRLAHAFQHPHVLAALAQAFGLACENLFLRIEYAQDTDGFWHAPHTDIGAEKFSLLVYLSGAGDLADLGTDIYDADKQPVARAPFRPGAAMGFVPSPTSYHGFEPRKITGIRKSLIVNYVTADWRATEQLAFPDQPVRLAA